MGYERLERLKKRPVLFISLAIILVLYVTPFYKAIKDYGACDILCTQNTPIWSSQDYQDPIYLVNTNSCKIMDMDPFDKSVKPFFRKAFFQKCPHPYVHVKNQNLVIDREKSDKWNKSKCCYRRVQRVQQNSLNYNKKADWGTKLDDECEEISLKGEGTKSHFPFFKIECQVEERKKVVDFGASFIPPQILNNHTGEKAKVWAGTSENERPPSVLIIGIDSISRMHMLRSLTRTKRFLDENEFVEMSGYTKLGENTFPNIMASLGGMGSSKEYLPCWKDASTKMDDCPLIWKNFSEQNYFTGLIEDAPNIAIFNYEKTGFVEEPTDYYLRPILTAQDKYLRKKKASWSSACISGQTPTSFLANYLSDFLNEMGPNYPYFLLSWFTSIGHDDFNGLQTADKIFLDLLTQAVDPEKGGNNTLIFFISDHGYRFGEFRETFLGFYEESLPFFFARFPPSLRAEHPDWADNLKMNGRRLTNPLDLYETLKDVLRLSDQKEPNRPQSRRGFSFFETAPINRTCEASGIPQVYCMCGVTPQVSKRSQLSTALGEFVVGDVNRLLSTSIKSGLCAKLNFKKFLYGREIFHGEMWNNFGKMVTYKDYLVALEVEPSQAHFEAKLRLFLNGTRTLLGDVSRVNSYKGQSDCVLDYALKNFCMCQDFLKKAKRG